jgi:hypothetical protein
MLVSGYSLVYDSKVSCHIILAPRRNPSFIAKTRISKMAKRPRCELGRQILAMVLIVVLWVCNAQHCTLNGNRDASLNVR